MGRQKGRVVVVGRMEGKGDGGGEDGGEGTKDGGGRDHPGG